MVFPIFGVPPAIPAAHWVEERAEIIVARISKIANAGVDAGADAPAMPLEASSSSEV
jgi:hypothetical protein